MLVFLCITMLIGSFFSGLIPLTLTFSEAKMKHITILGAGLLIGTALAVIIPEGIHSLYSTKYPKHINKEILVVKRSLREDFLDEPIKNSVISIDDFLIELHLSQKISNVDNLRNNVLKKLTLNAEDYAKIDIFLSQLTPQRNDIKILKKKQINDVNINKFKIEFFLYQPNSANQNENRLIRSSFMNSEDFSKLLIFLNQIKGGMNVNKVLKRNVAYQSDKYLVNIFLNELNANNNIFDKILKRYIFSGKDNEQKLDLFLNQVSPGISHNKVLLYKRNSLSTDKDIFEVFISQLSSGNFNNKVLKRHVIKNSDYQKIEKFLDQIGAKMNFNKVLINKIDLDIPFKSYEDTITKLETRNSVNNRVKRGDIDILNSLKANNDKINQVNSQDKLKENDFSKDLKNDEHIHDNSINESDTTHSSIGITLVLGFIFMLIVDQIGGNVSHRHQTIDSQAIRNKITFTTTVGLVVHAAADGIALGAAAATSRTDVEMIVFIAIMLHKAPAAFGLVSFLIHEGLERARVRKHLIVFAMAAPMMAIFTFTILNYQSPKNIVSSNSTGLCMLFSAGTFLYVSTVHVLPEVQAHNEDRQFRFSEMLSFIVGSIIPIFLSIGHSH